MSSYRARIGQRSDALFSTFSALPTSRSSDINDCERASSLTQRVRRFENRDVAI